MIFFTADTHFDHFNIIGYCQRPFSGLDEMNEALIAGWNAAVGPDDTIYHLGDFARRRPEYFLRRLNGRKHLIIGSHDEDLLRLGAYFVEQTPLKETTIQGQRLVMCHYAMRVWAGSHHGSWLLYGHSHGNLPPVGKSWDVGVDVNNFRPLSWGDIKEIMASRPDTDPAEDQSGERTAQAGTRRQGAAPRLTR